MTTINIKKLLATEGMLNYNPDANKYYIQHKINVEIKISVKYYGLYVR